MLGDLPAADQTALHGHSLASFSGQEHVAALYPHLVHHVGWTFDRPVALEHVRDWIQKRLLPKCPRLRQRLCVDRGCWEPMTHFQIQRHVLAAKTTAGGSNLNQVVQHLQKIPLSPFQPPWMVLLGPLDTKSRGLWLIWRFHEALWNEQDVVVWTNSLLECVHSNTSSEWPPLLLSPCIARAPDRLQQEYQDKILPVLQLPHVLASHYGQRHDSNVLTGTLAKKEHKHTAAAATTNGEEAAIVKSGVLHILNHVVMAANRNAVHAHDILLGSIAQTLHDYLEQYNQVQVAWIHAVLRQGTCFQRHEIAVECAPWFLFQKMATLRQSEASMDKSVLVHAGLQFLRWLPLGWSRRCYELSMRNTTLQYAVINWGHDSRLRLPDGTWLLNIEQWLPPPLPDWHQGVMVNSVLYGDRCQLHWTGQKAALAFLVPQTDSFLQEMTFSNMFFPGQLSHRQKQVSTQEKNG